MHKSSIVIASCLIAFSSPLLAQDDITSFEAIHRSTQEQVSDSQRRTEAFDRRQAARAQEDQMEQMNNRLESIQREQKRQANDAYWHDAEAFRNSLD